MIKMNQNIYWIDLFCGAGGTSTGIHLAGQRVIACVNHDENAIAAHRANHPKTKHFPEDIRDFRVVLKLKKLVDKIRLKDSKAIIAIWASLECTNFSKAKGGLPRDADSRTLADHMYMYLRELKPDYFWVENVREFMAWGPLNANGKPESLTQGKDFLKWVEHVKSFGYRCDWKIMNSANYGAYQSRERLFMQFAAKDLPIAWPDQTHSKNAKEGDLFSLKKWNAVRDVLDLESQGKSIFNRKKPLSDNTLKRIYAGLEKFVAKGEDQFIKKYFSGKPEGKVISVNGPAGTVCTADTQAIVSCHLNTYYGNGGIHNIQEPSPTLRTKDCVAKVDVIFIDQQYGNSKPQSIEIPVGSLTQNPKFALVNTQFIMNQYSGGGQHTDIDNPSSSITGVPKQNLISAEPWIMNTNFDNVGRSIDEPAATLTASRRHPYLVNANSSTASPQDLEQPAPSITGRTHLIINPSWYGASSGVNQPACTIVASQYKVPLYLLVVEYGPVAWLVFEDDSETMIKIKKFMVQYGITDIKMRMLNVKELLRIQGFPDTYELKGNQTEQKKQIGNAVEVNQARAIAISFNNALQNHFKQAA
jgi:DNA (cytosine-5)-methyltransferase 1